MITSSDKYEYFSWIQGPHLVASWCKTGKKELGVAIKSTTVEGFASVSHTVSTTRLCTSCVHCIKQGKGIVYSLCWCY